jgi:hypothetical protein
MSKRPEVDDACKSGCWLRIAAKTVEPDLGSPDKKYTFFTVKPFK